MWRDTCRCLEEYASKGGEQFRVEMIGGAITMFDRLQQELCPENNNI